MLYYAPSIFENIGFRSHSAATLATVGIGFTKVSSQMWLALLCMIYVVQQYGIHYQLYSSK